MSAGRKSETTEYPAARRPQHLRRLPCTCDLLAQIAFRFALVVDGLAVASDQVQRARANFALGLQYGVSVKLTQKKIQPRKLSHAGARGVHGLQYGRAHCGRITKVLMAKQVKC